MNDSAAAAIVPVVKMRLNGDGSISQVRQAEPRITSFFSKGGGTAPAKPPAVLPRYVLNHGDRSKNKQKDKEAYSVSSKQSAHPQACINPLLSARHLQSTSSTTSSSRGSMGATCSNYFKQSAATSSKPMEINVSGVECSRVVLISDILACWHYYHNLQYSSAFYGVAPAIFVSMICSRHHPLLLHALNASLNAPIACCEG